MYQCIYTSNLDSKFELLFFLPLSFIVACLFNRSVFKKHSNNLVVLIIIGTYFIRNVISIYVLVSIDNNFYAIVNHFTSNGFNKAIMIMSLDILMIFYYLKYEMSNNYKNYYKRELTYFELFNEKNSKIFKLLIISSVIFTLVSWFLVPQISENYTTIFDSTMVDLSVLETNKEVERGGIFRILLTLSLMLIKLLTIIISVYLLSWIRLKIPYISIRLLLFYIILFFQLLFISGNTMDVVLTVGVLFIVYSKIENNNKIILLTGSIGLLSLILIIGTLKAASISTGGSFLSVFLQGYFPGVFNLAGVFEIDTNISKLDSLFADFYTMIPFRNSVFGIETELKTSEIYNASNNVRGQIIPFIGEAFYYLGYLAFIVPILIIKIAFHYFKKANATANILVFSFYLHITFYFAISPILYHDTILGAYFFSTAIPFLILIKFNKLYFKKL
jgi:hypothetical protein